jgi:hypothetical protein
MSMAAYKLAALVEEFDAGTPAVQLVDRFLAGMPRAGRFEPPLAPISA